MPITVDRSHVIYRNPMPHLVARHAWHPTLLSLGGEKRCATFDIGQAAESLDYATYVAHSADAGRTWSEPVPLLREGEPPGTTHTLRSTRLRDGRLVAWGARFHRDNPREGLTNRENMGFVSMQLLMASSADEGHRWSQPSVIIPPIDGPAFEVCHSIVEMPDGRWLAPTSTWRGWDGHCPHGMKAVALVSHDQGHTWPACIDVMDGYAKGILHLEQSLIPWGQAGLVAVCWAYDERHGGSLPVHFSVSEDGKRFGPARPTDLIGETSKIIALGDDRLLCVYRRTDQPGLWAAVVQLRGGHWNTLEQAPVWRGAASSMNDRATASDGLAALKFGYPSLCRDDAGQIQIAFWCREDDLGLIRLTTLKVH